MNFSSNFNKEAVTPNYIRMLVDEDDASKYHCGAGVRFTLESLGIPHLSTSETGPQHGYKWADMLRSSKMQEAGWQEVDLSKTGWTPENSPPGVVWVYGHDEPRGNNNKGAEFGHVEISLADGTYASGGVFNNPGGSVRGNLKAAFVHPQLTAMMGDGPIPAEYARTALDRAHEVAQDRKGKYGDAIGLTNYDPNNIDFNNMTGIQLFGMIMSMFFGVPLTKMFPTIENTGGAGANSETRTEPEPSSSTTEVPAIGHPGLR